MKDLFETPIKTKHVRKGIIAYQYPNGLININGTKYVMHSMTSAIAAYRETFKKK